jgi:hypothetical protein
VLLVSASLLIRSVSLTAIKPGFARSVLTLRVSLPIEQATPAVETSSPVGNEQRQCVLPTPRKA